MSTDLLIDVVRVYDGSDGDATMALYQRLQHCGPLGDIALNLFRACKNSARAKVYRGGARGQGSYKSMAYGRKEWAITNLTLALHKHAAANGIRWGWAEDQAQEFHRWVLYIDTPKGQVSFHNERRGQGPDYYGKWDGERDVAAARICSWCAKLLERLG